MKGLVTKNNMRLPRRKASRSDSVKW